MDKVYIWSYNSGWDNDFESLIKIHDKMIELKLRVPNQEAEVKEIKRKINDN